MWGVDREAGALFTKAEIVSWEVASRAPRRLSLAFLIYHGRWQDAIGGAW